MKKLARIHFQTRNLIFILFIIGFSGLGTYLLFASHADPVPEAIVYLDRGVDESANPKQPTGIAYQPARFPLKLFWRAENVDSCNGSANNPTANAAWQGTKALSAIARQNLSQTFSVGQIPVKQLITFTLTCKVNATNQTIVVNRQIYLDDAPVVKFSFNEPAKVPAEYTTTYYVKSGDKVVLNWEVSGNTNVCRGYFISKPVISPEPLTWESNNKPLSGTVDLSADLSRINFSDKNSYVRYTLSCPYNGETGPAGPGEEAQLIGEKVILLRPVLAATTSVPSAPQQANNPSSQSQAINSSQDAGAENTGGVPESESPITEDKNDQNTVSVPKSKKKNYGRIIGLILIIATIGGLIFYFLKRKPRREVLSESSSPLYQTVPLAGSTTQSTPESTAPVSKQSDTIIIQPNKKT